jgi:hypothetical protein
MHGLWRNPVGAYEQSQAAKAVDLTHRFAAVVTSEHSHSQNS